MADLDFDYKGPYGNVFVTPDWITKSTLRTLKQQLALSDHFSRYDDDPSYRFRVDAGVRAMEQSAGSDWKYHAKVFRVERSRKEQYGT